MPDISHKEAGFVVVVGVIVFSILVFLGISLASRFMDGKEPKSLKAILDKINPELDKARHQRVLTTLLSYINYVEGSPVQHPELAAIFTLLAKTHLQMKEAVVAFYFSQISQNYYTMFEDVVNKADETGALILELRSENDRLAANAKLVLTPEIQREISADIDGYNSRGDIKRSTDWIRIRPRTEFS